MFVTALIYVYASNCMLISAKFRGWDLVLHGTSTPPAIDSSKEAETVPSKPLLSNDFNRNSIDSSSSMEFSENDEEV